MKKTIYWTTKELKLIDSIRKRFGITEGMTVNGENTVEIKTDRDLADLEECEKNGLIQLRKKQ